MLRNQPSGANLTATSKIIILFLSELITCNTIFVHAKLLFNEAKMLQCLQSLLQYWIGIGKPRPSFGKVTTATICPSVCVLETHPLVLFLEDGDLF